MSDSVKKYYEDGRKNLISPEEKRELEQVQKEFNGASLLVGLQIACDEEGLI